MRGNHDVPVHLDSQEIFSIFRAGESVLVIIKWSGGSAPSSRVATGNQFDESSCLISECAGRQETGLIGCAPCLVTSLILQTVLESDGRTMLRANDRSSVEFSK